MLCLADGRDVALTGERRNQMLAYLACSQRWATRDELATLLWAERDQAAARSNLRNVVMQVRRTVLEGFETLGETLRWSIASDTQAFEAAVSGRDWQAALAIYTGPLLEGFESGAPPPFADWLRFERARLEGLWRDALAARLDELARDPVACAVLARQVLQADPLNEAALAAFMRAQAALGAPNEAQRAWHRYVALLADELGIEPSAELRSLAAQLHATRTARVAAAAAPVVCIGRRLELTQLRQLLADADCRVLTLTGPGGVGKSTLARAALPLESASFADGSAWIALEDLTQTDQVAPRIAERLELKLTGNEAPLAQVVRHLLERQMLLVLDNAEHLNGLHRIVAALAQECIRLKLLITSRARLAIAGAWLLPLEGLPVPDRDEHDIDVLRAFDAVRLFELRAQALSPGWDLKAQSAEVVELAHVVEGLPLALELAAAWTRLLPVGEIVRELTRSLDVLAPADGANDRDRSLRASFEHSWRMLTPIEREVLPQLGVFVGSFSRAAAEHVAQASLPVLAALLDKSLLRGSGDGRFSLHPIIREYAWQRSTNSNALLARHANYYMHVLVRHSDRERVDQKAALAGMEIDLENCRAAWRWAISQKDAARLETMAAPLLFFFDTKGRWREGIGLMQEGLDLVLDAGHAELPCPINSLGPIAMLSRALAYLQFRAGHLADAETNAGRAAELYRLAGNSRGLLASLNIGGLVLWRRGQLLEAKRHFEDALGQAAGAEEIEEERLLLGLAVVEKSLGQHERALTLYERALEPLRRSGNLKDATLVLHNIGNLHRARKDYAAALACFSEGLQLCDQHGFEATRVGYLLNLGLTLLEMGEHERAAPVLERAAAAADQAGVGWWKMGVQFALCRLALAREDLACASACLRTGLRHARESGDMSQQIDGIACAGKWRAARGERFAAAILFTWVAAHTAEENRPQARDLLAQLTLSTEEIAASAQAAAALTLDAAVDAILAEPTTGVTVSA